MGFLSWLRGDDLNHDGVTSNSNDDGTVGGGWSPGDPDGVEFVGDDFESRSLPSVMSSGWSGWPADWNTPNWGAGGVRLGALVDTAWACLDLNASVMSAMPVYKVRDGRVVTSEPWMENPDPRVYSSWHEFAKQLVWDYQMGEAFVLATDYYSTGYPMFFRVLPPWSVDVEVAGGERRYRLGTLDITRDVLHLRYKSTIDTARGQGPLEIAGARMTAAGVLGRYVSEVVQNGGVPYLTLETDQELSEDDAQDLLHQWVASRRANLGHPAVLDRGVKATPHQMSPKDLALLEVAQFTESRIAVMLGVPPFLVGLPSGGDSMTYSNVSSLFDFHDRASLRPKASALMSALSQWALPRGSSVEMNRDEYSRPALRERVEAYEKLQAMGAIEVDEIRQMERLLGPASTSAFVPGGATEDD